MFSFRKTLWVSSLISFAVGISWGLKNSPLKFSQGDKKLILICKEDWISKDLIREIEKRLEISIERFHFENWSEYSRLLANQQGHFDVLCSHSFLAEDLKNSKWLDEFSYESLERFRGLSAEFRNLPFDRDESFFAPAGWRISGYSFKKNSKVRASWESVWGQSKKLSMNHPDLELYVRMKQEGLEIDPEKQGRYNRDPEGFTEKFMSRLGAIHSPQKEIQKKDFDDFEIIQTSNAQAARVLRDGFAEFNTLEDGSFVSILLLAVGAHSPNKELARKVINELLSPKSSDLLRKESGFAHVPSHFNDLKEAPVEMRPSFLRRFPLRSLRFPDVSIEGLPKWESYMSKTLGENRPIKKVN